MFQNGTSSGGIKMKIEKVQLGLLKPLEENVRNHSEAQIKEMIRSLNQFGQTRPMVVDEQGNILVGNGLYMALKERGDSEAEVYRIIGLTETQKKKLVLTDNKVYSLGTDNYAVIDDFLKDITIDAGDFDIAGFDEDMLKSIAADIEAGLVDDEDDFALIERPVEAVEPPQEQERLQDEQTPMSEVSSECERTVSEVDEVEGEMQKFVICPHCGEKIYL